MLSTSTSLILLAGLSLPAATPYPSANLIIEAKEVELAKDEKSKWRYVDARKKEAYEKGHIPGAVWVDLELWGKGFVPPIDAELWSKRLSNAGLGEDNSIVVYGTDIRDSTRIWTMLKGLGLKDVRVLNGGWIAWVDADKPIQKETAPFISKGLEYKFPKEITGYATKEAVLEALKAKNSQIIDARTNDEYCGTTKLAKKGGHIPGAIHAEWTEWVDVKTGRFHSPEDLKKLITAKGIDLNKPAVSYCQGGGRASVVAFGMELMGGKNIRNYYPSWNEWGNAENTPIDLPKK